MNKKVPFIEINLNHSSLYFYCCSKQLDCKLSAAGIFFFHTFTDFIKVLCTLIVMHITCTAQSTHLIYTLPSVAREWFNWRLSAFLDLLVVSEIPWMQNWGFSLSLDHMKGMRGNVLFGQSKPSRVSPGKTVNPIKLLFSVLFSPTPAHYLKFGLLKVIQAIITSLQHNRITGICGKWSRTQSYNEAKSLDYWTKAQ